MLLEQRLENNFFLHEFLHENNFKIKRAYITTFFIKNFHEHA